jgi:plastocyanin
MTRRIFLLAAFVGLAPVLLLAAAACRGGGPEGGISLEADDFYFEPKEIRAQAGQPLTIRIENEGRSLHTFTIESLGVDVELQPGQERTVTITPTGTVTFVCRLHLAQGMTGQITVGQ